MPSPYLDRLLCAAMKRRSLDTLALRALMKATHLLGLALAERLRQYRDSGDTCLDRFAQLREEALHAALLREAADILATRWDKLPERQRPHYSPQARFRILRIRALLALSADEAARTFRLSSATILRWEAEAQTAPDRPTVGSLIKPTPPVRRFADVARHLVQTLTLSGFPGDASVAAFLARAGWRLSRRTVQRVRKEKPIAPEPPKAESGPGGAGPLPPPHLDDRSHRNPRLPPPLLLQAGGRLRRLLPRSPGGPRLPVGAERCGDRPPLHEHRPPARPSSSLGLRPGSQFTSETFRSALALHGVRRRYGAVGRTGSIALIERFFLTLKTITKVGAKPPLLRADLERRLGLFFAYYACLRPHQALGGSTPAERFLALSPAHLDAVPPPRGRPGEHVGVSAPFALRFLDPEQRLPYLVPRAA